MKKNKFFALLINILSILFILFIGFVIGAGAAFISELFYLAFLFPILMGIAAAWVFSETIKTSKIRSKSFIIFLSILMGVVIYGTYHIVSYNSFRVQARTNFVAQAEEEGSITNQEAFDLSEIIVDYSLKEETGKDGFLGYMLLKAKIGVSIGKVFRSNKLNLGSFFTWVYWLVEFLLITGLILVLATKEKNTELLCEKCQDWITLKEHLGGVDAEDKFQDLQNLIQQKNFSSAGMLLKPSVGIPSIEVYAKSCGCDTADLKLSQTSFNTNNDVIWEDILEMTISSTQLDDFKKSISK